jgi:hypothetical protein
MIKHEEIIFQTVEARMERRTTDEYIANYLAMELLKAQRLANEIAYQQLRGNNGFVIHNEIMADFKERLV